MSQKFDIKVYTPKGLMLEKSSDYLRLPGKSGDIGVSYDHTPSLVECTEGEMLIKSSDQLHGFFITDSIAHINKDSVTVIVNHLESIENIDKKRAESSKKRALDRLDDAKKNLNSSVDIKRAKKSLNRAEIRLEILLKYQLS
tara:strand:+ start:664 stop:1089 length:426 start_codon:yes stop_codon:yes gene_type:complete